MASRGILTRILDLLTPRGSAATPRSSSAPGRSRAPAEPGPYPEPGPGARPGTETRRIDPARVQDLRVGYAPDRDGDPDAGEVIWTWVPYVENDGRGKDRPVLVIGRQSADRAYAVRMTSKGHEGDRDLLSIGSGPWDSQGRESWVDVDGLYSVHVRGMRREAAVLDRTRYDRVARALVSRYGWAIE